MLKYILLLALTTSVYAGERHEQPILPQSNPSPTSPTNDHHHNDVLFIGAAIAIGVCLYNDCLKPTPVKDPDPTRITPEPTNKLRIMTK